MSAIGIARVSWQEGFLRLGEDVGYGGLGKGLARFFFFFLSLLRMTKDSFSEPIGRKGRGGW